jgi:Holliday junction DNA helicase RuvB
MADDLGNDPLRPTTWDDYVGQESHKAHLDIRIEAALEDVRPLDHILLTGTPGTGKTSLAAIIAGRLGDAFKPLVMPVKPHVFASELRQFDGGVLFLDEVHRLPKGQQEDLLTLLEDGYLQKSTGQRVYCSWLTVIAATTEPQLVTPALYQRFSIPLKLDPYTPNEMQRIVLGMAARAGNVEIDADLAMQIGQASGGTPRVAGILVKAARDLEKRGPLTIEGILSLCRMDPTGLTQSHLDYLKALRDLGGTAGLSVLTTMLRLHETVVRDLERLLIDRGLILYGERGRELTNPGWNYGQVNTKPRRER